MSVTLSRKKWIKSFIACSVALGGNFAYAQHAPIVSAEGSGHSGGGRVTESDFRAYMSKIDQYLQTPEGALVFPEIVAYDKAHPQETFHNIILNTKPSVKPGKLFDANGEARDCMSYATPSYRYFVCNSDALPEKTLDSQPSFYRIVLHELLVQAGIEVPISKAVPSDYKISYRITENVHLETYQEWVPGKKALTQNILDRIDFSKGGTVQCILPDNSAYFSRIGTKLGMMALISKGNIWVYEYGEPNHWSKFSQSSTDQQMKSWEREQNLELRLGIKPRLRILWSSKIDFKTSDDSITGSAYSSDQNSYGQPTRGVQFKYWQGLKEHAQKTLAGAYTIVPLSLNLGKVVGQDDQSYSIGGKTVTLYCRNGRTNVSNSQEQFDLLESESLKNGNLPFKFNE